jgi:hypothetical protein
MQDNAVAKKPHMVGVEIDNGKPKKANCVSGQSGVTPWPDVRGLEKEIAWGK